MNTSFFVITHWQGLKDSEQTDSLVAIRDVEKAREKVDDELEYVHAIAKILLKLADN